MLTTIGMHYDVLPGKEQDFVASFMNTLDVMKSLPGHLESHLYEDVQSKGSFVILSSWQTKADFEAFIHSPQFAAVTSRGAATLLRGRPRHKVYTHE